MYTYCCSVYRIKIFYSYSYYKYHKFSRQEFHVIFHTACFALACNFMFHDGHAWRPVFMTDRRTLVKHRDWLPIGSAKVPPTVFGTSYRKYRVDIVKD